MDNHFIYVFDTITRDKLYNEGYDLIKYDKINSIYVFANKEFPTNVSFDLMSGKYLFSNIITF